MAIACAGYRVTTGAGHHKISLESVRLAIGKAAEIVKKAKEFIDTVEHWIAKSPPDARGIAVNREL
jgi:hypothetical protein